MTQSAVFSFPKLRVDQWLLLVWLAGVLALLEWTLVDRIRVFFLAQRRVTSSTRAVTCSVSSSSVSG